MKKAILLAAAAIAASLLLRMPHPARDVAKLLPAQSIFIYIEEGQLHIETDTGNQASGPTLTAAAEALQAAAPGEIFLETAQFLILAPDVPITEDFFTLLRPTCRVICTMEKPDLKQATQYLGNHQPNLTLAQIRAERKMEGAIYGQ